jgi:hypothetical protein
MYEHRPPTNRSGCCFRWRCDAVERSMSIVMPMLCVCVCVLQGGARKGGLNFGGNADLTTEAEAATEAHNTGAADGTPAPVDPAVEAEEKKRAEEKKKADEEEVGTFTASRH